MLSTAMYWRQHVSATASKTSQCTVHSRHILDLWAESCFAFTMLFLQAAAVQLGCMAYEFWLLQRCNVSHMRLFSVFLALPSATVRLMAARQLQVDDDSREEVDEDDMDALPDTAAATEGDGAEGIDAGVAGGGGKDKKQKSVRLDAGLPDDDDEDEAGGQQRTLRLWLCRA
jgi:hypothetical protein